MNRSGTVRVRPIAKSHKAICIFIGKIVPQTVEGRIIDPQDQDAIARQKFRRFKKKLGKKVFRRYEPIMDGEKICRTCGDKKSVLAFHKDAGSRDGRRAMCAECKNEQTKISYRSRPKPGFKYCKGCGENKSHTEFYTEELNSDGLKGKCKDCIKSDRNLRYVEVGQ